MLWLVWGDGVWSAVHVLRCVSGIFWLEWDSWANALADGTNRLSERVSSQRPGHVYEGTSGGTRKLFLFRPGEETGRGAV